MVLYDSGDRSRMGLPAGLPRRRLSALRVRHGEHSRGAAADAGPEDAAKAAPDPHRERWPPLRTQLGVGVPTRGR
eukprot:ctg_7584.g866